MKKISVFNHITIDGFFAGSNVELDWFYSLAKDDDWEKYTHSASGSRNTLSGRK